MVSSLSFPRHVYDADSNQEQELSLETQSRPGPSANALGNFEARMTRYSCWLIWRNPLRQKANNPSGAVKSNLGHLEGASGLASVIKAVLALEKGVIPPNTNFECLNPEIDDEFFNLQVCARSGLPVSELKYHSFPRWLFFGRTRKPVSEEHQ